MLRLVSIGTCMLLLAPQAFSMNRAAGAARYANPFVKNHIHLSGARLFSTEIKPNELKPAQLFTRGLRRLELSTRDREAGMRDIEAAAAKNDGYALYLLSLFASDPHESKKLIDQAAKQGVDADAYILRESYLLHDAAPEQD